MNATTLDRTAGNILALLVFYHKQLFKSEHGITGVQAAQYRLLGLLKKEGTQSMTALGTRLFISKPYMTSLVDALIMEGWVERQPDTKDRRVINIMITEAGNQHLHEAHDLYKSGVKKLLADLDENDLSDLCASSEMVATILKKIK
jgi:DNA-binding MarR family transcriptional regulator